MNASNKKTLAKHLSTLQAILDDVARMQEALNEKIDNASERWLESDNGEIAQSELSELDSCVSDLENAIGSLENLELGE